MATTRMMLQRQQGCHVTAAALLVAMCIVALSAMLAPAPLAAAAAAGVSSAGATLGTTSVSDAVGKAAATIAPLGNTSVSDAVGKAAATIAPLGNTSVSDAVGKAAATVAPLGNTSVSDAVGKAAATIAPAAGDNVVFDTAIVRDLCRNLSNMELRKKTCGSVLPAACAALDAKTKASLSVVTNSVVDRREVAGQVLSGLDSASRARTTACILALPIASGKTECFRYGRKKVSKINRKYALDRTKKRLIKMCFLYPKSYEIPACDRLRDEKCLDSFRQGKTTIEENHVYNEKDDVEVLRLGTFKETVTRRKTSTVHCCSASAGISDRCLCQMKKKLGNNTTIPCLKKKELEVCK